MSLASAKKTKPRTKTVAAWLPTYRKIRRLCGIRGWSLAKALDRMADRELDAIAREQAAGLSGPTTAEIVGAAAAVPSPP